MILPITPRDLRRDVLDAHVLPDLERHLYWTDRWDPAFYAALAYEGFISIAHDHAELGPLLIPEMQRSYAVLDWPRLHASRHVRRLRASGRLERERVELVVSADPRAVMEGIATHHGARCWVIEPYRRLIRALADGAGAAAGAGPGAPMSTDAEGEAGAAGTGLVVRAIEVRAGASRELVAGELGYTIGRVYTSLSGFCRRDDAAWNHFGTLQLVLLGERLRDAGYAFWNLGHPRMRYKRALGARTVPRERFLARWRAHRDESPARDLAGAPEPCAR